MQSKEKNKLEQKKIQNNNNDNLCEHTFSKYSQYFYRLMRLLKRLLNSCQSIGGTRVFSH